MLDLGLPGVDGLDVARTVRQTSSVPIIVLTARGDEADRVVGLELGADDYVVKPFSPRELLARIRAVLRRVGNPVDDERPIVVGGLVVDPVQRSVQVDGRPVELTATEFDLLARMAAAPGRVFTSGQLLETIHGIAVDAGERAIDAHVKNLRRKIEPEPHRPSRLLTVHGVGYRLVRRMAEDARWWRRRFLRVALVVSAIWIASGVVFGLMGGYRDGDDGRDGRRRAARGARSRSSAPPSWRRSSPIAASPDRPASCSRAPSASAAATTRPRVQPVGSARRCARSAPRSTSMAGRLDASESARRRFLADVTHELRTPLTVLQAEVEAQLDGIHPRDDAHLQLLRDQSRTLDRLVEDLRTLALGDAGRLTLHREPCPSACSSTTPSPPSRPSLSTRVTWRSSSRAQVTSSSTSIGCASGRSSATC